MSQSSIQSRTPGFSDRSATPRRLRLSEPVKIGLSKLSIHRLLNTNETPAALQGAGDREMRQLSGPRARLQVEDVRWNLIGYSVAGRRHLN